MVNLFNKNYDKICLTYANKQNLKKRYNVRLIFSESKKYYFAGESTENFIPPAKNAEVEIQIYTPNGIYTAFSKIKHIEKNFNEIIYEVQSSEDWKLIQLRKSSRKRIELSATLTLSDGKTINATTEDLSLGGVSFFTKEAISSIDKKLACNLSIKLPEELTYCFPNGELKVNAKYVKENSNVDGHFEETLYAFKFLNISKEETNILKDFLIKLN